MTRQGCSRLAAVGQFERRAPATSSVVEISSVSTRPKVAASPRSSCSSSIFCRYLAGCGCSAWSMITASSNGVRRGRASRSASVGPHVPERYGCGWPSVDQNSSIGSRICQRQVPPLRVVGNSGGSPSSTSRISRSYASGELSGERTAVAEVHRDVTYLHRRAARHLGAEADRHALVGLYADHDRVLAELACCGRLERQVRRALEHDGDLGDALAETLAGTKIERHTGPAAGVDVKPDRRIGLGGRRRVNALLLQVSDDVMRALPAGGVLSASGVCGQVLRQTHRGEDLRLLGGQVGGGERDRLLHGGQGQQLQQMVLDDVARCADAVVVSGAAGHADVLGHRDLHVVDVVGVPDRLVHRVGETQRQHVLHGFLAEIMVDAEHARRVEHLGDHTVELLGAGQIVAERLLDDHATPSALGRAAPVRSRRADGPPAGNARGGTDM